MDYRLHLLLTTFNGLKLDAADLHSLWENGPAPTSAGVVARLRSERACAFLTENSAWVERAEILLHAGEKRGIRWSFPGQADYPASWHNLECRPAIFSYRGRPVWLEYPLLAIVGSRSPMDDSRRWLQRDLPKVLRQNRVGTVSGGARGVDQWAHRLSLASGRPTVCIFPGGLLNPYPGDREDLWEDILLQDGCLLSTFAPNASMRKSYFPIRNRWIAGMAGLVFIVEANRRSGTQLTAQCALKLDREICTLPVSPLSAQGLANLDLLEKGATLIRDAADLSCAIQRTLLV